MNIHFTPLHAPTDNQTKDRRRASDPLSERVRQSLDAYFDQLDGTEPSDLYQMVLAQTERPLLERVMQYTGGNQTRAAVVLGISRATLRKKELSSLPATWPKPGWRSFPPAAPPGYCVKMAST